MNFKDESNYSVVLSVLVLGMVGLAAFAGTASAQGAGNVAVEMQPSDTNVNVGDDIRIDMVVVDPDNGVQGVDFNATTSAVGVAEFEDNESAFDFENEGDIAFGGSTATVTPAGDNRWVNTDAIWDPIFPADTEVTVGTFNLTATGTGIAEIEWVNPNDGTEVFEDGGSEYTITDTVNATVQVGSNPNFDVGITGTNSPIDETDTLSVDVEVTNTGDITGTQTITLTDTGFGNQVRDSVDVTLNGGETNSSITLEWNTQFGDNGTADVTVASENDTASQTVEIQALSAQPISSCTVIDESGPYQLTGNVGPTSSTCIEIRASDVTFNGQGNSVTGDSPGFGEVGIFVNGTVEEVSNVEVSNVVVQDWDGTAGLEYNGANGTASNVRAFRNGDGIRVSGGSSASGTVVEDSVARDNTNGIDIAAANGVTVSSNEAANNQNGITEDGDSGDNDYVNNNASANTNIGITISGGSSNLTNNEANSNGQDGVLIDSGNNVLTGNEAIDNENNGFFVTGSLNNLTDNQATDNGNGIRAIAGINDIIGNDVSSNTNGIELDTSSDNTVEDNVVNNNDQNGFNIVSSDGNTFTNNTVTGNSWDFSVSDSSGNTVTDLDIGASTEPDTTLDFTANDIDLRSVTGPASDPAGTVNIGRYFEATNTSSSGFLDVDLNYEDNDVPSGADETSLELFRYNGTDWVPVGSTRDTTNNLVSANITEFSDFGAFADTQPFFDVEITDTNEPVVEGNSLTVNGTVTNTGLASDTQEVNLTDFNGNEVDSQTFTLNDGESDTFSLTWNTNVGDTATDNVTVASEDDTDQEEVRIVPPVFFDVQITGTNSPVAEGDTLRVDGTVENLGGETGTQELNLTLTDFGGNETDNESITLNGFGSDTFSFTWDTEVGDNGTGSVTVFSENTSDQATVTVSNRSESGTECINRRNIGRGQEGQECPRDRGLSRGESRGDLDERTERRNRRDRGRGESRNRGRGR